MDVIFSPVEVRVLGALIEKEITTPDCYPLSLNALTLACNQKSNRDPAMDLDEKTVVRALDSLGEKKLARRVIISGNRVPKYRHTIFDLFEFSPHELGLLCVLFLRGPQTVGELRARTARLCKFNDLAEVEATFQGLMDRDDGPFAVKLPREVGRRERRYAHLFCGEVTVEDADVTPPLEPATLEVQSEERRIAALEKEVVSLRKELKELKQQFIEFTKQFE